MPAVTISVVIPSRNEGGRVEQTIRAFAARASAGVEIEYVVADDASTDGSCIRLRNMRFRFPVKVVRCNRRRGVAATRNLGVSAAKGEVLFITDAHVRPSDGWDRELLRAVGRRRVVAATITDPTSRFVGYGCRLVVPFMGTHWNRTRPKGDGAVHVASAAGTGLLRELFWEIGGYDEGMRLYGAAEPEFSLRAWLSGADIRCETRLRVTHRFKSASHRSTFLRKLRPFMIHNNIRFGMLYLSDEAILQMLRHFAMCFPRQMAKAMRLLIVSDVWRRRKQLKRILQRDFYWFVRRFALRDQVGGRIL